MKPFELRFFENDGTPSLILHQFLSNSAAAIRSGKKMARGRAFEVWRGKELIYGIDDVKALRNPERSATSSKISPR